MSQGIQVTKAAAAAFGLALLASLPGCSSGSSGSGNVNLKSLSGSVRGAGGGALEGVTISVGTTSTTSNASGDFILPSVGSISSGQVTVTFDGTTALGGGTYPSLSVIVRLTAGAKDLVMPQVITLPDLAGVNSAQQTVGLNPNGSTTTAIAVAGALPDLGLSAPVGTIVSIGGMVGGAAMTDINITPVEPDEVPMPLPDGLQGLSFVTIQPGNASFSQPTTGAGLDVVFPNSQDLPIGTQVDIWSFDYDDEAWVNRSNETGQSGTVVDVGGGMSEIQASGVVTEGGWHTPVVEVDADCATTFTGQVIDIATDLGIPGASIALSTGQFAVTDSMGNFTIDSVPAYDTAASSMDGTCTAESFDYEVVLPPAFGSLSSGVQTVDTLAISPGGTTQFLSAFSIPSTGSIAGLVSGDPATMGEEVQIVSNPAGGFSTSVEPDTNGAFFLTGVPAGEYIASFQFAGQASPTEFDLTVTANQIATLSLQFAQGQGGADITVTVFEDDDNSFTTPTVLAGAQVVLQGSDSGSALGLIMTTDQNGQATFEDVSGPYTVTAVKDFLDGGDVVRIASTVVDVSPANNQIGVLVCFEQGDPAVVLDATLAGVVSNVPTLTAGQSLVVFVESTGFDDFFRGQATVDPNDGSYSLSVPSGVGFETMLALVDDGSTTPFQTSLFQTGIAPVGPAESGAAMFDYADAGTVAWDQSVSVDFSNVIQGAQEVDIELCAIDRTNEVAFFIDVFTGAPGPATLMLPDFSAASFAAYEFILEVDAEVDSLEQDCSRVYTSTPTSVSFNLLAPGALLTPAGQETLTLEQLADLMVSFDEAPNGGLGSNGVNRYFFDATGGAPPSGIDESRWAIWMRSGTETFEMPLSPLPMFGLGQVVQAGYDQIRIGGTTLAFNSFFNQNLDQNLDNLFENYTSAYFSSTAVPFETHGGF